MGGYPLGPVLGTLGCGAASLATAPRCQQPPSHDMRRCRMSPDVAQCPLGVGGGITLGETPWL